MIDEEWGCLLQTVIVFFIFACGLQMCSDIGDKISGEGNGTWYVIVPLAIISISLFCGVRYLNKLDKKDDKKDDKKR